METFLLTFGILLISISISNASWGTPGSGQYHIQTDEGPERYFRYQTDSGQYRKEKRLQDGTVIGTDAWIDASGFLRQKDYIADTQGYRILKSKTVFVGQGRSIEEAVKSTKNLAPQAGTLVKTGLTPSKTSTTVSPFSNQNYVISPVPTAGLGYDHYRTPTVYVRPHSEPIENSYVTPLRNQISSSTAKPFKVPSRLFEPPLDNNQKPITIYQPSTTSSPIQADYGSPIAVYPSSTPAIPTSSHTPYTGPIYSSTTPSPFSNSISTAQPRTTPYRPSSISSTTVRPYDDYSTGKSLTSYVNNNHVDNVQPLYSRPTTYQQNNYGNGYDPQYPLYDGVSVTNNGFRYYLPRQYHEEESLDSQNQHRIGSFGYIDPFGIRRVIYYNTSPDQGFVHRKNNRYVGFNATPYDPRPL